MASSGEGRLAWERHAGQAEGIGICLSGGGVRAASFGLGVIQALQTERGLFYGAEAARYLSAVSGGSYVAAAHAVNAQRLAAEGVTHPPPLAHGSPEEQHILNNGRYLVTPVLRTVTRFVSFGLLNLAALVMLFIWAGTMLGDAAVVIGWLFASNPLQTWLAGVPLLSAAGLVVAILVTLRGMYSESAVWRYFLPVLGLAGIAIFAEPTFRALAARPWFTSGAHWVLLVGAAAATLALTAGLAVLLRRLNVTGIAAAAVNWAQVVAVRVGGGVLLIWSGLLWYRLLLPLFEGDDTAKLVTGGVAVFASLLGGLIFSYVPDRASLHREYRNRIRSCFGIVRSGSSVVAVPPNLLLSQLGEGRQHQNRSPQLLICVTANVGNEEPLTGRRRAYAPFVFTHDVCGVPGTEASYDTTQLELGHAVAGLRGGKEPLVTVFTAVATTGAAASPSMGRYTLPSARPLLAALNLRLGRWLPNPFSPRLRARVASRTTPGRFIRDTRMGPGYDELIPEMLCISGTDVYVSDGGHYDNLGLLTLIRARCAQIWCVDSSPDPAGAANELKRVLAVAKSELDVTSEINLKLFAADTQGMLVRQARIML